LEIFAANLSKAGFSWGCSSEINSTGRVLFTADAYAPDGRRFTVLADDRLTAFLELQTAIYQTFERG
jgi:HD superfamily phosphohydrolase YqeK